MTREAAIRAFIEQAGWGDAARAPLAGDASARRYERLRRGAQQAVLMDVPPASGIGTVPFLGVTRWLRAAGFSAPEILAADTGAGLVLLEDLGDASFAALCADGPGMEAMLYGAAVDCLVAIQRVDPPEGEGGWMPPVYDLATALREARLAAEWYLPVAQGAAAPAVAPAEYVALIEGAVGRELGGAPVPVLVDYHAENLFWLPGREGLARVGIIDHQDLRIGPPAYDLVSVLEDARRDTGPELRAAMVRRYLDATGREAAGFERAAAFWAAQRNLKILGLFTRLVRAEGKPRYLEMMPRVWAHLMRDLEHPALAELGAWVRRNLPPPDAAVRARIRGAAA